MVKKSNKQTIVLAYRKSTKGTHVFGSDSQEAFIPSLYVRKTAFGDTLPKEIKITMEIMQ